MSPDAAEHLIIATSSVLSTGAALRFAAYVAKALPPLRPDAGWWATFSYNLLHGVTGIDPSSVTLSPTAMSALPDSVSQQVSKAAATEKAAS